MRRANEIRVRGSKHLDSRVRMLEGREGERERHSMVKRRTKELCKEIELVREGRHCTISQEETASLVRRERTREYSKELQSNQRPRHFFRRDRGKSSIESMPLIQHHTSLPPELSGEKIEVVSPNRTKAGSPKKLQHFRRR